MIVIFEGPDASGKTSLLREFNRETSYAHITVDRLHLSHMVYSSYYERKEWTDPDLRARAVAEFRKFMFLVKPLIVLLEVDAEVAEKRVRERGEKPEEGPDSLRASNIFKLVVQEVGVVDRLLTLNTSFDPPVGALVERIVGKIGSLERSDR